MLQMSLEQTWISVTVIPLLENLNTARVYNGIKFLFCTGNIFSIKCAVAFPVTVNLPTWDNFRNPLACCKLTARV